MQKSYTTVNAILWHLHLHTLWACGSHSRLPSVFPQLICMAHWGGFWQLVPRLSCFLAQPCKNSPDKETHHYQDTITFGPSNFQCTFLNPFSSATWEQLGFGNGAVQPWNSFQLSKSCRVVGREQSWQCSWCIWLPDVSLINIQTPTPSSVWSLGTILPEHCSVAISEEAASRWESRCPCT